jgi:hypothetical protein
MKIQRPGNTEFNLIFAQFCENHCNLSLEEQESVYIIKNTYVDWIYKTAGYYDSDVRTKELYSIESGDYTYNLKEFINNLAENLRNSDKVFVVEFYRFYDKSCVQYKLNKYIEYFKDFYNIEELINETISIQEIKKYINKKRVLIISSFSKLIEQQIISENIYHIHPEFKMSEFIFYKFPYCFYNSGVHKNSFETFKVVCDELLKLNKECNKEFDIVLLSCGCIGGLLVEFITQFMDKSAIYVGGILPFYFGIVGNRHKELVKSCYDSQQIQYLILNIPDEYKPQYYLKIEDGCYW